MPPTDDPRASAILDPRVSDILDIVATETQVPRDKLALDARIDELGIASLDIVQAIFAIETRYDVEIPPLSEEVGTEFTTVGDLVGHVLATLDARSPAAERPAIPAAERPAIPAAEQPKG